MTTNWSDNSIDSNKDLIRKQHLQELKSALAIELSRRNINNTYMYNTSDYLKQPEIKEVIDKIKSFSPLESEENIILHATTIKGIQAKINALELKPKEGGVTDCNLSCVGLCVSCTGSCTETCTGDCKGSCTGCTTVCTGCTGSCLSCTGDCKGCTGTCNLACDTACGWACNGCNGNSTTPT